MIQIKLRFLSGRIRVWKITRWKLSQFLIIESCHTPDDSPFIWETLKGYEWLYQNMVSGSYICLKFVNHGILSLQFGSVWRNRDSWLLWRWIFYLQYKGEFYVLLFFEPHIPELIFNLSACLLVYWSSVIQFFIASKIFFLKIQHE